MKSAKSMNAATNVPMARTFSQNDTPRRRASGYLSLPWKRESRLDPASSAGWHIPKRRKHQGIKP